MSGPGAALGDAVRKGVGMFHGAGEAIRGNVNAAVDSAAGDKASAEKNADIASKGATEMDRGHHHTTGTGLAPTDTTTQYGTKPASTTGLKTADAEAALRRNQTDGPGSDPHHIQDPTHRSSGPHNTYDPDPTRRASGPYYDVDPTRRGSDPHHVHDPTRRASGPYDTYDPDPTRRAPGPHDTYDPNPTRRASGPHDTYDPDPTHRGYKPPYTGTGGGVPIYSTPAAGTEYRCNNCHCTSFGLVPPSSSSGAHAGTEYRCNKCAHTGFGLYNATTNERIESPHDLNRTWAPPLPPRQPPATYDPHHPYAPEVDRDPKYHPNADYHIDHEGRVAPVHTAPVHTAPVHDHRHDLRHDPTSTVGVAPAHGDLAHRLPGQQPGHPGHGVNYTNEGPQGGSPPPVHNSALLNRLDPRVDNETDDAATAEEVAEMLAG